MVTVRRTVLIVDDHPGFRASARALLEAGGHLDVIGEVGTGTDALAATLWLQPDIVLLDITLPDLDGFTVCESIIRDQAHPTIVVLTSSRDRAAYGPRIAASPARGFIAKDELTVDAFLALAE